MNAVVEISIAIRVEPEAEDGDGISEDAELVVNELCYVTSRDEEGAFFAAAEALRDAIGTCEKRADEAAAR